MFKLFELSPVTVSLVLENHNAKRTQSKQVMDMPHLDSLCCTSVPLFKSRVLLYCHSVAKLCLILRSHGFQHIRLPCLSPSLAVCSNSCPLSRWWHPTISSCVVPFSSCPQSFFSSGPFPVSWFCASGGQRFGLSASISLDQVFTQQPLICHGHWRGTRDWLQGAVF